MNGDKGCVAVQACEKAHVPKYIITQKAHAPKNIAPQKAHGPENTVTQKTPKAGNQTGIPHGETHGNNPETQEIVDRSASKGSDTIWYILGKKYHYIQ